MLKRQKSQPDFLPRKVTKKKPAKTQVFFALFVILCGYNIF